MSVCARCQECQTATLTSIHNAMSEIIARLNTALEGRYSVREEIGAGGMATVYIADDLRHDRSVALKVLKPELAAVVGAERFLTEIKVTAGLQHPNILPLFDSGEADSFLFYVMPHVEGESLRDRLDRERQLSVDEGVRLTISVAQALDHAHRKGVVHRDIKPANILLQDGEPVVADFGIALAVDAGKGRLTETGLSIGTPYYMSPEQATGDSSVGPTSDVYSLACVLYEFLAGEPPYGGGTAQAVLGRIIAGAPVSVTERRPTAPGHVDAALRKALEKIPADRFGSAAEFAKALGDESFRYGGTTETAGPQQATGQSRGVNLVLAGVTAVALLLAGWALTRELSEVPRRVVRTELTLGPEAPGGSLSGAELSPDGTFAVLLNIDARGVRSLYVRRFDELAARQIPGTEGAFRFAISPSGTEVAFAGASAGHLRVVSIAGGGGRTLAERVFGYPVWGADYLYFTDHEFRLGRVPVRGGPQETVPVTVSERASRIPTDVLPGNDAILFTQSMPGTSRLGVHVLSLASGEVSFVVGGSNARYVDGYLVYANPDGGQVMAAPFDLQTLHVSGPEVSLISGVANKGEIGIAANFSVSESGDLVYALAGDAFRPQVKPVWVDRTGVVSAEDLDWHISPAQSLTGFGLSHDGYRLAASSQDDAGAINVWVKDLRGGPPQRISFDAGVNTRPFWGPDDKEVFYFRDPDGAYLKGNMLATPSDGSGTPRMVVSNVGIGSGSWGIGQEWMVFRLGVPARESRDIYGLQNGASEARALVATGAIEEAPSLSPDGRWLLYQSDRSGEREVYVRPFPNVEDGMYQVSVEGGTEPRWARSGNEIFYRDATGQMTAAQVTTSSSFRVTDREVLFDATLYWSDPAVQQYDVAADDQRFIMLQREPGATAFVLVLDWIQELRAEMNAGND
jgi:eukaryotic-like serine/threonine-protein kinase